MLVKGTKELIDRSTSVGSDISHFIGVAYYAVTHMQRHKKNNNIQGRSPNVVKWISIP